MSNQVKSFKYTKLPIAYLYVYSAVESSVLSTMSSIRMEIGIGAALQSSILNCANTLLMCFSWPIFYFRAERFHEILTPEQRVASLQSPVSKMPHKAIRLVWRTEENFRPSEVVVDNVERNHHFHYVFLQNLKTWLICTALEMKFFTKKCQFLKTIVSAPDISCVARFYVYKGGLAFIRYPKLQAVPYMWFLTDHY